MELIRRKKELVGLDAGVATLLASPRRGKSDQKPRRSGWSEAATTF